MASDLRLRPHHLLCGFLLPTEVTDRGPDFARVLAGLRELVDSSDDTLVQVVPGVDDLCSSCPDCGDGRCESVFGDEDKVLRWDARVLDGLGIASGALLTTREIRALVREKAPMPFCRERCPWSSICGVFGRD